jgi:hypothetical protein
MQKIILTVVLLTTTIFVNAQTAIPSEVQNDTSKKKEKSWFEKNVKISQSMETAEQKELPAQFQVTLPKKDSSSWLVNLGVAIKLNTKSPRMLSKLTSEFHKNTLTDKEQENYQIGYSFTRLLSVKTVTDYFLAGDAKYVSDAVEKKQSIASNLLFTFMSKKGPFNRFLHNDSLTTGLKVSPFVGLQLQESFKAKNDSAEGLILRPLFTIAMYYDLYKKNQDDFPPQPTLRFSANYTGRVDAVNSTKVKEDYTQLFSAGLEWFLAYTPARFSIGASFNYGSDPLQGLAQQQYWLISFNIYK